jgi:aspartate/methionine/tyrosine aminotransferase
MRIPAFSLERYFARYEFSSRYLLSASDCEALSLRELVERADAGLQARFSGLRLAYTESAGLFDLREEIATLYENTRAEDVLTVVPEEGIFILMNCLLRPGDHVVSPFPAYESLYRVAEALGCEVSLWRPREDHGWRFHAEDLEALLRPRTRLVVLNFPHNPTGCQPDGQEFRAMVDSARRRGAYLFSDEMYRYLEPDTGRRLPAASDVYEKAVSLAGLSKAFGMPGLRLGWLATRDRTLLADAAAFKDYTTICGSGPSELLALMALRDRHAILSAQRERVARNRTTLADFLSRHEDLFAARPGAAGPVCFPRVLAPEGAEAFCRRVQDEAGIMILPSTVYGFGDAHARIGLGREDFHAGLDALAHYLNDTRRAG